MSPRWLLAASVSLNFFLAGIAATQFLHGPSPFGHRHSGPPGPAGMLADMTRHLNPVDAEILRSAFRSRGLDRPSGDPVGPGDQDSMERLMDNLRRTISARDFDPAAFKDALNKLHDKRRAEGDAISAALEEAVVTLSPEGREQLAAWLPQPGRHGGPPPPPPE